MRTIASAVRALHFCASVIVFGSVLRALFPSTFAAFLSRAASSVFGVYDATREQGLGLVGAMIPKALSNVPGDYVIGIAPHGPPTLFWDAVIFLALQIPIFFVIVKAAGRIKPHLDRERNKDRRRAPLSSPLGMIAWRRLAANIAVVSAILALGAYYAFAYGGGLAALLAFAALIDRIFG